MAKYNLGRSNLDEFVDSLYFLAKADRQIIVLTCDSRGSGKLTSFGKELPDQIIELGIAEQNLVGVSAGLASAGKIVFAVAPASFLTARALEQIKNDTAYSNQPVKLVGITAGVSYGSLGTTHHSIHDFAVLQAIHNLTIIAPADNFETRELMRQIVKYPHPTYLRFGKKATMDLPNHNDNIQIGKARTLKVGADITFIGIGEVVAEALKASDLLDKKGISSGVISLHTLKPLDKETIIATACQSKVIVTVEEHSVFGGLGSTCASLFMQECIFRPIKIVGIPDEETITGSQDEIFKYYGMKAEPLAEAALRLLESSTVAIR